MRIGEADESSVPPDAYADAFEEITSDAHQQLLVGGLNGEVVATCRPRTSASSPHIGMKYYPGGER